MFGDRGVLRPGQTLVERDDSGLCHSRQCSRSLDPASGFYLLRTSSINCSAHCQPVRPAGTSQLPPHAEIQEFRGRKASDTHITDGLQNKHWGRSLRI